jgi:dolichyl-phosphate-mannose--protein O-mannosyl transferase
LGKLILYSVARLYSPYPPDTKFESIGSKYSGEHDGVYVAMRWSSALFGSLVPPQTFLIARELGLSVPASLVPAVAQVFDSLVVIESRLILMDAQLLCFMAACLLCALRLWAAPKQTARRAAYLVATALFGALSLSIKWTALATPGLVALVSLAGFPFPSQGRLDIAEMAIASVIAVAVYMSFFYVHFALLPCSGQGDKFMSADFERTLIGSKTYNATAVKPSFLANFAYLNSRMLTTSASIKTRHRWESKWYQWIVSQRGVLYHVVYQTGDASKVYLTANLVVVYTVLIAVIAFLVVALGIYVPKLRAHRLSPYDNMHGFVARGSFIFAGYFFNLLPYIAVNRCTFLYHYVPALFYGELAIANAINALPRQWQRPLVTILLAFVVVAYFVWSPWIYATQKSHARHKWLAVYGKSWT